jgi:hypothetical protein
MAPPNGRQVIVAVHAHKPIPIGTLRASSREAECMLMNFDEQTSTPLLSSPAGEVAVATVLPLRFLLSNFYLLL